MRGIIDIARNELEESVDSCIGLVPFMNLFMNGDLTLYK